MLRFYISRQTLYPGRETPLALTARNVKQAEVRFYRLNLKADDNRLLRSGQWKNVKKWPKTLSYTLHHTFKPAKASEEHTDSLQFHLSQPGIYLCELLADNRHTDHNIIYVSSVTPLMLNTGEGLSRIVLVDAGNSKYMKPALTTRLLFLSPNAIPQTTFSLFRVTMPIHPT